jgi:hypothetical protein
MRSPIRGNLSRLLRLGRQAKRQEHSEQTRDQKSEIRDRFHYRGK